MEYSRPEFFRDRRFIKKGNKTTIFTNNNAVNSYELQMNAIEIKKHNKTNASKITGLINKFLNLFYYQFASNYQQYKQNSNFLIS